MTQAEAIQNCLRGHATDNTQEPKLPIEATEEVIFMCSTVSDTAEYDKVTVKP